MKSIGPFFPAKHTGKCPLNYVDGNYGTHTIIAGDLIVRLERPVQWTETKANFLSTKKLWHAQRIADYVHLECLRKYQERE